jgi:hypothetical protein
MNLLIRGFGLATMVVGLVLTVNAPAWSDGDEEGDDWPMFGHDALGTRFSPGEKLLGPASVAGR